MAQPSAVRKLVPMMTEKVFIYVVRTSNEGRQLLVFHSHDEPGFEVPKGSVEPGETPTDAVHRELFEESGISAARIVDSLGVTQWRDETQHFFLVEVDVPLPNAFQHTVTGADADCGMRYGFLWLPLSADLDRALVQGCSRFVRELLRYPGIGTPTDVA